MAQNQYEEAIGHEHINDKYQNTTDHDQTENLKEKRVKELKQELNRLRQQNNLSYQVSQHRLEEIADRINKLDDQNKIDEIKANL